MEKEEIYKKIEKQYQEAVSDLCKMYAKSKSIFSDNLCGNIKMKNCEEKLEEFLFDNTIYHNDVGAEGYGFRAGWKAALKWIYCDCCPEDWSVDDIEFDIEKELEYETKI